MTREEATVRLASYVPMLLERFPPEAFTVQSLEHVAARAVKGFPTYGELAQWLASWWRDHRPTPLALPPPEPIRQRGEPTAEEKAHASRVVAETVAFLRSHAQPAEDRRPGPRHLTPEQLDVVNPLPGGLKRHAQH